MKKPTILTLTFFCIGISFHNVAKSYNITETTKRNIDTTIKINVPDFADAMVASFYKAYAAHIINCVKAIRTKDVAKINAALDNGNRFNDSLPIVEKKVTAIPAERQKFRDFLIQTFPYQKEIVQSEYYKNYMNDYLKKRKTNNK